MKIWPLGISLNRAYRCALLLAVALLIMTPLTLYASGADLYRAASVGDLDEVREQLAAKVDPNYVGGESGWTPLHIAAKGNHAQVVAALLDAGADINIQQSEGWTALHLAAQYGRSAVAGLLLEAGADVNMVNKAGWSAVGLAEKQGHSALADRIVEHGGRVMKFGPQIYNASLRGELDKVLRALELGADPKFAADEGMQPIHSAASMGHVDILDALVEAGADVNVQQRSQHTPLTLAVQNDRAEMVAHLIALGADVNVEARLTRSGAAINPIHLAVAGQDAEIIKLLLDAGASADGTKFPESPPVYHAIRNNDLDTVNLLFQHDASIDAGGAQALHSPLHLAAQYGSAELVARLLELGARPELLDMRRRTALDIARERGDEAVIAVLEP